MKRVLRLVLAGLGTPALLFGLGLAVFPGSWLTQAFLAPGLALIGVLGPVMPGWIVDAFAPAGGPEAAVLITLIGSVAVWAICGTLVSEILARRLRGHRVGAA